MDLNTIYLEDCMKTMSKMEQGAVDITVTSPPYNMSGTRMSKGFKAVDYDNTDDSLSLEDYFNLTPLWITELLRVTKYHVFWNIQELKNNKGIVKHILNEFEDKRKETFIWAKTNPTSARDTMVASGFEYIFCFSNDDPSSGKFNYCNFSNLKGDYIRSSIVKPNNSSKETKGHGYAFGEWLPEHFIRNFSKPGAVVYDPFMGTGTTAKAALNLGRSYIGSEISEKYLTHAEKRLKPYKNAIQLDFF